MYEGTIVVLDRECTFSMGDLNSHYMVTFHTWRNVEINRLYIEYDDFVLQPPKLNRSI